MGPRNLRRINRSIGSVTLQGEPQKRDYTVKVMKNYSIIYQEMSTGQKDLIRFARSKEEPAVTR